jgi:hypothetical protein
MGCLRTRLAFPIIACRRRHRAVLLAATVVAMLPPPGLACDAVTVQSLQQLSTRDAAVDVTSAAALRVQAAAQLEGGDDAACLAQLRQVFAQLREAEDHTRANAVDTERTIYEGLSRYGADFDFVPGDVVLIRNNEITSSAVSQVGEFPSAFSHAAIVGFDPQWKTLEVIESLVNSGVKATPLMDWVEQPFVRMAVYRHHDRDLARKAAIAAFRDAAQRRHEARDYDFSLSLGDAGQQLYCTEVVTQAYAHADPVAVRVPMHLSSVGTLLETFPLAALGAREREVFLPDDLELDPRFARVIELRVPALLPEIARMDGILRSLFDALRGPQREPTLARIEAQIPSGPIALPYLLQGSFAAYRKMPEAARPGVAGLARLVAHQLDAAAASQGGGSGS